MLANYPGVSIDRLYAQNGWRFCCERVYYQSISGFPFMCIDNSCTARGYTAVTQKTLPAAGQCLSGDTPVTLTSASSCASLTADGSTIYVGTSTDACCDSIPSGTFVCKTPPPTVCTGYLPEKAEAVSTCLAGDVTSSTSSATTCDDLATSMGVTLDQLYTTAGSNICCTSVPIGTTVCVPATPSITTTTTTGTTSPTSTSSSAPSPSDLSDYDNWDYVGCFVDSVDSRTLPNPMGISGLTVELCLDACNSAGFKYAGMEWSQECYCGNTLPAQEATDGRCSMVCDGEP